MDQATLYGTVLPITTFFALGALFGVMERLSPARRTDWKKNFGMDVLGLAVVWTSVAIVGGMVQSWLAPMEASRVAGSIPTPARVAIYFVASDMARYITHWAMHSRLLWRMHRFHHSPTNLYWFSGNRATPGHVFLFLAPALVFAWYLQIPLEWVFADVVIGQVFNNIMHTNWNVSPRVQRALEWVITTPRYHALHHSTDPALHNANLSSIFTVWDRLTGHYVDPDTVPADGLEFGADQEEVPRYRMVLGA